MRKIITWILLFALLLSPAAAKSYQFIDHETITGECIAKYNPPAGHQVKIDIGDSNRTIGVSEEQYDFMTVGCVYYIEEKHTVSGKRLYSVEEI